MRAKQIVELLAQRHSKDLFIPECKDGSTWFSEHLRLDAWAMLRSWTHEKAIGYEIKVSRSDFLSDNKLQTYMQYCHEFYIVAPSGIVQPNEIPEGAGLIVPSANCTRLYTKVKAPYRNIEWPVDLLRYILIARVTGISNTTRPREERPDSKTQWEAWLKKKHDDLDWGQKLRGKLRKIVQDEVLAVRLENKRLQDSQEKYAKIKQFCDENDIPMWTTYDAQKSISRRFDELRQGMSNEMLRKLRALSRDINYVVEKIEGEATHREAEGSNDQAT
jgi:hypothetical protein